MTYYLPVTKLSALLKQLKSTHIEDFYCLNCYFFSRIGKRHNFHVKMCTNHKYCQVSMPEKSITPPFLIYVDFETMLEKIDSCKSKPKNQQT